MSDKPTRVPLRLQPEVAHLVRLACLAAARAGQPAEARDLREVARAIADGIEATDWRPETPEELHARN